MAHTYSNVCPQEDDCHVFGLLTRLSEKLVKENSSATSSQKLSRLIKKSRSIMYETLLGKKHVQDIERLSKDINNMSPVSRLITRRSLFNNLGMKEQYCEIDDIIQEAFSFEWHNTPDPILRMLICLTDSHSIAPSKEMPSYEPFQLSKKLSLMDTKPGESKRLYPALSSTTFQPPAWMNIKCGQSSSGHVTSILFNKEPGEGLPLFGFLNDAELKRSLSMRPIYQVHPIPLLDGPRDLTSSLVSSQSNLEDEGYVTPMTEAPTNLSHIASKDEFEDPTQIWSEALTVSLPQLKSWETLGNTVTQAEPPFISAGPPEAIHHLSILTNMYNVVSNNQPTCDHKPISRVDFLRDVFLLLIGIESINFLFVVEDDCFVVRKGMWLEGYCVEDTSALCQDLIFCGTHFRRLEKFSHTPISTEKNGELMIQALKNSVLRWIQFYQGAVLTLITIFKPLESSVQIYKLLEYIQALKQQVDCVSRLCHVYGPTQTTTMPNGVALLAYMYKEACMPHQQQNHLLYSALKSCCEVYLHRLQRWIFLGDCSDDKECEFFVHRDASFSNKRDRSFWTRGFLLDQKAVPDFLLGLEGAVFECGRAMNLLKLCSPQHPLCMLLDRKHPAIRCCLYKSDLEKVFEECAQFETDAQRICSDYTNISKLLEEESEQEVLLQLSMQQVQKERAVARAKAKLQLEKERAERREKQNADLKAQIIATQQKKEAEKEQKRIEDELYLLECKRLEEIAKIVEEEERQKVIAYYEELGKTVDKQNRHKEWQLKRLKIADKRQAFLFEDTMNLSGEYYHLKGNTKALEIPSDNTIDQEIANASQESSSYDTTDSPASTLCDASSHESEELASTFQIQGVDACMDPNAQDLHKEASAIKAKVLQIEFGITSGKSSENENTNTDKIDECKSEENNTVSCAQGNMDMCHLRYTSSESNIELKTGKEDGITNYTDAQSGIIKSHDKVLTTEESCELTDLKNDAKKTPKNYGVVSELERNRQRVLYSEFNTITGIKMFGSDVDSVETRQKRSKNSETMSDLERNRRKVLGEEYNIFTGEVDSKNITTHLPEIITSSDSGIETVFPEKDQLESCGVKRTSSTQSQPAPTISLSGNARPSILSLSSEVSVLNSPFTPLSAGDMPVFTSPFKGTNHLPNELPLASPLLNPGNEKVGFAVGGIPFMVDIAYNFASNFDLLFTKPSDHAETLHQTDDSAEASKIFPNISLLESSLQTCLLIPLRVQHRYVSAALLHYFLVDLKLLSHFKSLRSYFFMQDGEFGQHVTTKLFSQMYKVSSPNDLFNKLTLDKIVQEALAGSQGSTDPNNSRLSLTVKAVPDHFSHSSADVFDCLLLFYDVKWPLNLLLTQETLEKYNLIFLFLVRLKRIAWLLQEDFVALKNTARGCFKEQHRDLLNSPQYHQVQIIRHSMSQFLQATLNYVSSSVLHASWTDFASSLKDATTLDHLYNAHIEYMKRLLKRCLLNSNSKRVEAVLSKILITIIKFHGNLRVRPWQVPHKQAGLLSQSVYLEHPNFKNLVACATHFKLQVSKLVSYLERLISPPNPQQHLAEYLLLLNINGFFKSSDYLTHVENAQESDTRSVTSSRSTGREFSSAS